MNRVNKAIIILVSALYGLLGCNGETMTPDELKFYVSQKEHGLKKSIKAGAINIDVFYYPKDLIIQNQDLGSVEKIESDVGRETDSIDYFLAKFESPGHFNINTIDLYNSQLIVEKDTLESIDAIFLPGANTTSNNFSILYAFKSNIWKKSDKNILLFLDKNHISSMVKFLPEDILNVKEN